MSPAFPPSSFTTHTYIHTYIYINCILTKTVNLQELYKDYLNLDGNRKFICQKYERHTLTGVLLILLMNF